MEEYVARVYRFALRLTGNPHDAEDLTQEVMLRAWRSRRRLRDPRVTRVWLFRITVNLWNDTLRRRGRSPIVQQSATEPPESPAESPERTVARREDLKRALAALDGLPRRQREVVYLHVCEGLTLTEVAQTLDIGYSAAKASLAAGRKRLRNQLKDLNQDIQGTTRRRP